MGKYIGLSIKSLLNLNIFCAKKKFIWPLDIRLRVLYSNSYNLYWSDGRVVERGGLENRCTLTGTGGSNPSRSVLRAYKAS